MKIMIFFLVTIVMASASGSNDVEGFSVYGKKRIAWESDQDGSTFKIEALETALSLFSDSGDLLIYIRSGESLDVRFGDLNDELGLLIVPDTEKNAKWTYSQILPEPSGGFPLEILPGERVFRNGDALLVSMLFLILVLAVIRVLNSYSYSFLFQPIAAFGRGLDLERFSSGVFPIIFLGVFIGFSTLLGYLLDLVIPGVYSYEISSGGFIVGETPTTLVFLIMSLAFIIIRFLFYSLLSFVSNDKSLGAILFSSSLIMASVLLIILTIIVSLLGFGNFVYDHPRIVAFIFIIFAALFGIGMLFTHLNMGLKSPISVRFFGIVAMEILPTVVIVKVLIEG